MLEQLTGSTRGGLVGRGAHLVLGGAIVVVAAASGWKSLRRILSSVLHHHHAIGLALMLPALIASFAIGYGVGMAQGGSQARRLLWGARAGIAVNVLLAWLSLNTGHWLQLMLTGGLLAPLLILHQKARSYALGWIYDDNGERQKVTHVLRGRSFFNITSHKERLLKEIAVRDERRRKLFWASLWLGGAIYLAYRFHHAMPRLVLYATGGVALIAFVFWIVFALKELFYQLGYQDMDGHKVLDPDPVLPGMQTVVEQKAHGDARLASLAEALRLLRPNR